MTSAEMPLSIEIFQNARNELILLTFRIAVRASPNGAIAAAVPCRTGKVSHGVR